MIKITQIDTKIEADVERFIEIPYQFYKDNTYWVPPLRNDIRLYLNRELHPIHQSCAVDFFIASRNDRDVGRVMLMKKPQQPCAQFALFECENHSETAKMLFDTAEKWAQHNNATQISGPQRLDFFEGDGILIRGFESSQIMDMAPYHHSYYVNLFEENEFARELDFTSHHIERRYFELPKWLEELADKIEDDRELCVQSYDDVNSIPVEQILGTLQQSLAQNHNLGHADAQQIYFSITQRVKKGLVPEFIKTIFYKDTMISAILGFPDFSDALRQCQGIYNPKIFSAAVQEPRGLVINGFGIVPEFQGKGTNAILFREIKDMVLRHKNLQTVNVVQVTATNQKMQSELNSLGIKTTQVARRYYKKLSPQTICSTTEDSQTLRDLLQYSAMEHSHKDAFVFLEDGENSEMRLSFGELDKCARRIAQQLMNDNLTKKHVLLVYPPGLDFIKAFVGCIYANVVAIPCYLPRKNTVERFKAIYCNSNATAVLSNTKTQQLMKTQKISDIDTSLWLYTDAFAENSANETLPVISCNDIAMIQYTSGSTLAPRGVVLRHKNLCHNIRFIQKQFGITLDTVGFTWLPPYHDMGLIGSILVSLVSHTTTVCMAPVDFLRKPLRWLQAISKYKVEISGGPNFAYELCIDNIKEEHCRNLDLSSWKVAYNGAEFVQISTLERFHKKFAAYGFRHESFYPCYGLAEATLMVCGGVREEQPALYYKKGSTFVSCGHSANDVQLYILNPDTQEICCEDEEGEIYVAGPSIAQEYWDNPLETAKVFTQSISGIASHVMRTGDMGFMKNGELFVSGRRKNIIVVRGKNYYPHDLESIAQQSHEVLRANSGAAFTIDSDQQAKIVLAFELMDRRVDIEQVATAIRAAISSSFQLEIYNVVFIKPGHMPKTTSGKIQRHICRKAYLDGKLDVIAQSIRGFTPPMSSTSGLNIERDLQLHLATLLAVDSEAIHLDLPVKNLGLSSLTGVSLINYIEEKYDIEVPVELFFSDKTVRELVQDISQNAMIEG
ncbi:AMP-binding protein [Candidatus Uabimicrobium amorphum]|uniref:Acyl-CoA synthetase n=1 Tax=Uabimicrobium amorphum TaxID=2596890 RepID=A0A5S9IR69_UABAM|nr:AMP-binding protein [Candidatus Uabimicrobium amorphum]BBM86394.1 acyl-CoA synthetase [Candidatus Uabimicrobium amorphum]